MADNFDARAQAFAAASAEFHKPNIEKALKDWVELGQDAGSFDYKGLTVEYIRDRKMMLVTAALPRGTNPSSVYLVVNTPENVNPTKLKNEITHELDVALSQAAKAKNKSSSTTKAKIKEPKKKKSALKRFKAWLKYMEA